MIQRRRFSLLPWLVALVLALAVPLQAQTPETEAPNYVVWGALASLAESSVEDRGSSEDVLNAVRAEVVGMRTLFLSAQAAQRDRIATLREQIAALGPPPEEGATESPDITQRRTELNGQLSEREAPLLAADEAFRRADAIVRAIDRELRARQADALMALGPTPLNPANWLAAVDALISSALTLHGETYNAWLDPARYSEMVSDLPITLGAVALALLLLLRGRRWMEHLTLRLLQSTAILRGRAVAAFVVSLSQLLVPFGGLILLSLSIRLSRMTGITIEALAEALVPAGMAIFVARWLSLQMFPIVADPRLSLNMAAEDRRSARGISLILGIIAGIEALWIPFLAPQTQPATANAALMFPLVVVGALTLLRFARVLRRHRPRRITVDGVESDSSPYFDRMLRGGTRVLQVVAILAPILGAAGYMAAATQLVFPAISSLALISMVLVLHRLVTAIYLAIVGDDPDKAEGLVPALAGFMLSMAALPMLALVWGARETDLWEIWTTFSEGFSLGGTRISPANILSFFVVFVIGYMSTRALQGALGSAVLPKTKMEKGAQKALVSGVGYVGLTAATLVAFSTAGIDLSGLAIVAGALSVGIGFGLQNIVSNFVSGIILLIERPVSEGDWVEVGTTSGIIQRISVRSTMIETFDRSKVIVPNADLISGAVTNFTKSSKTGRMIVPVGVAYGTDTRKVERILREIVEAEPLVVLDPKPGVLLVRFGADSLDFEVRAILRDVNFKLSVTSEINHRIVARFAEEGIEIPFAQRDIWLRNPEVLTGGPVAHPPIALADREPPPRPATVLPEPAPERDPESASESPDQTDDYRPETR